GRNFSERTKRAGRVNARPPSCGPRGAGTGSFLRAFLGELERERGERRKGERGGVRQAVRGQRFGGDSAQVALVRAAVVRGVGVEHLIPEAGQGKADAVLASDDRGEIEDDKDRAGSVGAHSEEADHALALVRA